MFICKPCLSKHYDGPKWADIFRFSGGTCEICGKPECCADIHHSFLIPKDRQTEWECVNKGYEGCVCPAIRPNEEVIELEFDLAPRRGLVHDAMRLQVTFPDCKAIDPVYAGSIPCALAAVKRYLISKCTAADTPPKLACDDNGLPLPTRSGFGATCE